MSHHFGMSLAYIPTPVTNWLVVERSPVQSFAADHPLYKHLGFNLMQSTHFFLLSPHSRLLLFQSYVVVCVALGVPSNSMRGTYSL